MIGILGMDARTGLSEYLRLCAAEGCDADAVGAVARATIRHLNGDRSSTAAAQVLERRWYKALDSGGPDYTVYDGEEYLGELWACWWVYSRKYLNEVRRKVDLSVYDVIVDLGCGFGFTTAALKQLAPHADVIGTNVPGAVQTRIAKVVAEAAGASIAEESAPFVNRRMNPLVFASEYFEHFYAPAAHLDQVVSEIRPTGIMAANAFGTESVGHFREYDFFGAVVPADKASRAFNERLRHHGYEKVKTGFWNGRPAYWSAARELTETNERGAV